MERLTNKKEADAQRKSYERRLEQGYPRNIPEERFLKLAAYEDAEEQGRLLVLPCKVGDKFYQTDGIRVYESTVRQLIFDTENIAFDVRAIGKTVFRTREAAEAALSKGENE